MKRLLFISHCLPYPPDKGERIRAFHELKALSRHFRITLAALDRYQSDSLASLAASPFEDWCERVFVADVGGMASVVRGSVSLLRGKSVTEGFFHCPTMLQLLMEVSAPEPFDLIVAYSSGVLPLALRVPARARVADLVDLDSAKWDGYAEDAPWLVRRLYAREARAVRALEQRALNECDAVSLVSEAEVDSWGDQHGKLIAVSNGVDSEYFAPTPQGPNGSPSLVFTGTMDYRPNVEAVCWFANEVWPLVRSDLPDATFTVVGRNPTWAVQQLAQKPGVTVTGSVADVRPYLSAATASIAPLRLARGIQNKVLEAMAMGKPVVASPAALEGLEVEVGREALSAETPDEWRQRILQVKRQAGLAQALGQAARARVVNRYNWDARMQPLVELCLRLSDRKATPKPAPAAMRATPASEPVLARGVLEGSPLAGSDGETTGAL